MITYTYALTDFPETTVNLDNLKTDIDGSSISVSLSHIDESDSNILIYFRAELDSKCESTLDDIVENHSNIEAAPAITEVKIKEEEYAGMTQGHFQARTLMVEIEGDGTYSTELDFPYPISLFSSEWLVSDHNVGDGAEFQLAPNTTIGYITAPVEEGDLVIQVSSTVVENIKLGYWVRLNDHEETIGQVTKVNKEDLTIEVESGVNVAHTVGTLVKMTIKIVPVWDFTAAGFCSVGENKIGASFIPEGSVLKLVYHARNGNTEKRLFGISIDYMY